MQSLLARHPDVGSFEMETFQLLHLARVCRKSTVHASAASIVVRETTSAEYYVGDSKEVVKDVLRSKRRTKWALAYTSCFSPLRELTKTRDCGREETCVGHRSRQHIWAGCLCLGLLLCRLQLQP